MVFIVDGVVTPIRAVDPDGTWNDDDRGFADVPLTDNTEADNLLPRLPMRLGDHRPHEREKIREYITL